MPEAYLPEFGARVRRWVRPGRTDQQVALDLELSEATI